MSVVSAVVVACGLAGSLAAMRASAEPVQMVIAIATHAPTSAKSAIPGAIPGGAGAQTDPRFTNMNVRSYHSPSGSRWIIGAGTNLAAPQNVLVTGSGLNISGGALAARETVSVTTTGDPFLTNTLQRIPRINDAGHWALATGSTGGTRKVVLFNGTDLVTLFGVDSATPGDAGVTFGGTFNSVGITQDDHVGFMGTVGGVTSTIGPWGVYSTVGAGTTIISPGFGVPEDQGDFAMAQWVGATTDGFSQDATGAHWLVLGKLATAATIDQVVVVDNHVKLQEGYSIPGSGFTSLVSTISDAYMESNGDWYARGSNADASTWVLRNGVVVAVSGGSVTPGSSEHWKINTSFRDVKGNPNGYFVISGLTDNADLSKAEALVLNGRRVLARLSDPVDLNADGAFAGSLFLHTIQDKGTYCADGYFYFSSRLKAVGTGTTTTLGNNASFLRVLACPADYNGSGVVNVQDIFDFLSGWFAGDVRADFDGSSAIAVQDIFAFLSTWFTGC
jgi:hypothetical protein